MLGDMVEKRENHVTGRANGSFFNCAPRVTVKSTVASVDSIRPSRRSLNFKICNICIRCRVGRS